ALSNGVVIRAQRGEAARYSGFVFGCSFFVMLLHLGVDQLDELILMVLKHINDLFFIIQIRAQMVQNLTSQFVKEFCMLVVIDVVKINEAANQIILESRFRRDAVPAYQPMAALVVQMRDQNVFLDRQKTHPPEVKFEVTVA